MIREIMLSIGVALATVSSEAQESCASNSRLYWEWPSHNNWYIGNGSFINFTGGSFGITSTGNLYPSYEGTTAISDDSGGLRFFGNGPNIWNAAGVKTCNNCIPVGQGGTGGKNSATQGIITVRHPLNPKDFYIFSTDDAVTSKTSGLAYTTFDASGKLTVPAVKLGNWRTTEGVTATLHDNGIDIWVSAVRAGNAGKMYSFLITCDGVSTSPIISSTAQTIKSDSERGAIEFSPDGSKAIVTSQTNANPDHSIYLYDFDNSTGNFSNGIGISAVWGQWWWLPGSVTNVYDVEFSPDGNRIYVSGGGVGNITTFDISSGEKKKIYNSKAVIGSGGSFGALEMGGDGNIYHAGYTLRRISGNLNSGVVSFSKVNGVSPNLGLPNMFLPPLEEPDIHEVGPFCDTDPAVDLKTTWICSGLLAEDPINNPIAYSGSGIENQALGVFNPANAGVGTHEIIFNYCNVNDTILIVVNSCNSCTSELKDTMPEICIGESYLLDDLITDKSNLGVWTIDSFPLGTSAFLTTGIDVGFNASGANVVEGKYKLLFTVNDGAEKCYDSVYIVVNPLPKPSLGLDTSICLDASALIFNAGSYSSYKWFPNGETTQKISTNIAGEYIISVVDGNGCKANDSVNLIVNSSPVLDLGTDITICPGTTANFDGGLFSSYLWHDGGTSVSYNGTTAETIFLDIVDSNGCIASDTAEIFMSASLPVKLGNDTSVCLGDSVLVNSGYPILGYTFLWDNGSSTPMISVTKTGRYELVVKDAFGCSGTDSIDLVFNPNPQLDLGPDVDICPALDSTFTVGTGWTSVLWSDGSTAPSITLNKPGVYSAAVVGPDGCIASDTIVLDFYKAAILDLGSDITICPGTTANFDGGLFSSYLWHDGGTSVSYNGTTAETIFLDIVDSNGCIASDTAEIFMSLSLPVSLGNDTAICDGKTLLLNPGYSTKDYTVLWDNGSTKPMISVTKTGIYGLVVKDAFGCSGSDSIDLLINDLPSVDLGNDKALCSGDSTTLRVNAGLNDIVWSTYETSKEILVKLENDYSVSVTDSNNCVARDTVHLTINNIPIINIGKDQTLCFGSSFQFDAGIYSTYEWHDQSTLKTYSSKIEELVYVIVRDSNGCLGTDTANVFLGNPFLVNLGNDTAVCKGSKVNINSGFGSNHTFLWNTLSTAENIIVSNSGIYSVEVTDENGCLASDSINVILNPYPIVNLGIDKTICEGDSTSFNAVGNWQWIEWNDLSLQQVLKVKTKGTYTVTVTDLNGCKGTDSAELIVNQNPTVSLGDDIEVCKGKSVTIKTIPNNFASYLWQDGSVGKTFTTFTPEVITLLATDLNGCKGTDTVALQITPGLDINLPSDQQFCEGENYTISVSGFNPSKHKFLWSTGSETSTIIVNNTGVYNVFVTNNEGCSGTDTININVSPKPIPNLRDTSICEGETATFNSELYSYYKWTPNGEIIQSISAGKSGEYSVLVTDKDGCSGSASANLTVYSKPNIPSYPDQQACEGGDITLGANLPRGSYLWNPNKETTQSIKVSESDEYTVSITNSNGCIDSVIINTVFNPNPIIDLGIDKSICEGDNISIGYLDGIDVIDWNNGIVSDEINVTSPGDYIATITDPQGCVGKDTINITVNPNPILIVSPDTLVCIKDIGSLKLEVLKGSRNQLNWSTGETTEEIFITKESTYYITATNEHECSTFDTINVGTTCISALFVPNSFTPNGDRQNDLFGPVGVNIYEFDFYIFDRWGEQIFHSIDVNNKWDGTYNGKPVQIDVYVWKVSYRTEENLGVLKKRHQAGTVTVLR